MILDEELALLLAELGLGTYLPDTVDGSIFLGDLPPSPDAAIAVRRYGGTEADSKLGYDEPRVQLKIRGDAADFRSATTTAQAVYDALHGLSNRDITPGGTWLVLCVGIQSGPIYLGVDALGRHEHTLNFRLEVERPTAHRP